MVVPTYIHYFDHIISQCEMYKIFIEEKHQKKKGYKPCCQKHSTNKQSSPEPQPRYCWMTNPRDSDKNRLAAQGRPKPNTTTQQLDMISTNPKQYIPKQEKKNLKRGGRNLARTLGRFMIVVITREKIILGSKRGG